MSDFNVGNKVKIPSRRDDLVYDVTDKYKEGHEHLKEGQYLVQKFDDEGFVSHAFILESSDMQLVS